MNPSAVVKRVVPFVAALGLGLFITSFFVDLSFPRFRRGEHRHQCYRELKIENDDQKREIEYLRRQIEEYRLSGDVRVERDDLTGVPLQPGLVPPPPIAPVAPHPHFTR